MVNAVILSGDTGQDGKPKALLKIGPKYMIEYIIKSLRDSECVNKIYVVGDKIIQSEIGNIADGYIDPGKSIVDNIKLAAKQINSGMSYIFCTSDIPMVSGDAIRDFVEKCEAKNTQLGYPIIDKKLNDEKYPDVKRTYVKMREGTYTGGNIIYMTPEAVGRCTAKAELLVEYRKDALKMGRVLGFTFLIRLALGLLTIPAVETKIKSMFDVKGSAILTSYPEIGNDVDKPADIEFVNKYMNKTV